MTPKSQFTILTQLLNLPEVSVIGYQQQEDFGIILQLEAESQERTCPHCGYKSRKLHQNHWYLVRDLPIAEQQVYLRVNRRQFRCEVCKKKLSEDLKYVEKYRTYTKRFSQEVVGQVLASNIRSVAKKYDLDERTIGRMLKDAGKSFLKDRPSQLKRLGIDEIALRKGQGNYCAVLVDLDSGKLITILEGRTQDDLRKVFQDWGSDILEQIEEVSIDLWRPYKSLVEEMMPNADVVADRFHVMQLVNDELDNQRKTERKEAEKSKDEAEKERVIAGFKKSKYAILKNEDDLNERQKEKLEEVKEISPKIAKMHELKESFRSIFEQAEDAGTGTLKLLDWLSEAATEFPASCKTITRWFGEIVGYFEKGTNNGVVEGINNKLKLIKRLGYGFRNFENFKLRSLLSWYFEPDLA